MMASAGASSPARSPRRLLAPLAGAAIVLAIGVATSFSASSILSRHMAEEAQARFESRSGYVLGSLERRLDDFSNLILGMQGLFIASANVNREEFRRYSETLNLQQRLPGLQALSFQRRVVRQDKAAFLARVRNDRSLDPQGYPDFAIRPEGERAEYLVIDYIEPLAVNRAALGYDAATQAGNADAIRLARDTGRMQVSEPFNVVQSPDGPPRIVLRAPVFRRGQAADSVLERRAALEGFVVLTVETRVSFGDYFSRLLDEGERLTIEDAGLFEGTAIGKWPLIADIGNISDRPVLSKRSEVEFGGRKWQLSHSADATWVRNQPGQGYEGTVLASGSIISLLLAALYFSLASARQRAWQMVDRKTRELRESEERFRDLTELSSDWYWEQDAQFRFTQMSVGVFNKSGLNSSSTLGMARWELPIEGVGEDGWAAHRALLERHESFHEFTYQMRIADSGLRWFSISGRPIFDAEGRFSGYRGTGRDITLQTEAETRLREQAKLLRTILDHMNQGISVVDADLRMVGCNRRFIELLGFPANLYKEGTPFEDFVRFNAERGEYGPGDKDAQVRERVELARRFLPHNFKRTRLDGSVIEIFGTPLPGGGMVTTYTDVTEQERTQQALARSEHFHRSLVEISPDAIFAHRGGIVLFANPAAARLFGAARPEGMGGLSVEQLVAPEDRPQVQERIESLISGRLAQTPLTEKQYMTLEGRRLTVESSGTLIDLDGQPAILTVARDITERKRAENALRESEERFRRIIEQSPISMAIVAMDGSIEFVNRKAIDTFGYLPPDIPDMQHWWALAYPDASYRNEVITQWIGLVEKAIAGNHEIEPGQYRVTCKDGKVKIMEIFGVPVSGKLFVMFEDVTERELAARRILQERDFRQRLIESIPGVFYLFDQDGRFLLWNRNFETVVGYSAEEMAAAHPLDFFEGSDRELVAQRIGAVLTDGNANAEAQFKSRTRGKRPYFFTGERIMLEDGRPGVIGVGFDISERKHVEETLTRQTAILQATLEAMDQGISVVDADLRMNALNRKFCELLEFPESMAREGADFAEFVRYNALRGEYGPGDVEEKVREMVARARLFQPHHFKRTRPNGRIIEIQGKPMPGGGFVTTYSDITEQEHAQEALRLSEQRYRNLIELSPDAIFVHRNHIVLIANPAAARLWGISMPKEAIGRNLLDFIHPDSHAMVKERIARLESDATLFRLPWAEQEYLRPDGSAIPVEGSATVIELDDGPAILSVIRDISLRKHAEDNVRRERDFRQHLIDSIPGIFFLFDPSGHFLLWNRNLESVLGMSAEEIAGSHTLALYDEADRDRIRQVTKQVFATGASTTEATLLTSRGERIPYFISGIRIDVDGKQTVIGLGLDITERKLAEQVIHDLNDTLEQRVRERTAALEASNRELESFSYSVSHDLRAPLRALHGFSHLLEEEYAHRLDSNGLDYLRRIRNASQRMGDLIDDLINLARVSRQELKRGKTNLSQLAVEIADDLLEQTPERAVVWNIAPDITASADPLLMRVALENLLGNAWKFTAKTPGAVIEFGAVNVDGAPAYFVRDNGAGFEMAYVDKLFKPFQRLHRPDDFAGTGIGLATVHRIVKRHGGLIWAEGAVGQGAAFHFTLP